MKTIKIEKVSKDTFRQIIIGLVLSLLILIIPIVGYSIHSHKNVIWSITFVVQICFTLLWVIAKFGAFSTSSHGFKRVGTSLRDAKLNKLGTYSDSPRAPQNRKKQNEIKNNKKRDWWGIYMMLIIAAPELILMLVFM